MPSPSPILEPAAAAQLDLLAQSIRAYRKRLRISTTALAEVAGMSRVTVHRIEHGEPSVTMGAYLNAMTALGLKLGLSATRGGESLSSSESDPAQIDRRFKNSP